MHLGGWGTGINPLNCIGPQQLLAELLQDVHHLYNILLISQVCATPATEL